MASGFYGIFSGNSGRSLVAIFNNGTAPETDANWDGKDGAIYIGESPIKSMWYVLDGAIIHVATQQANGRVAYHTFSTTTELWVIENETVHTEALPGLNYGVAIAVRSTGVPVIVNLFRVSTQQAQWSARTGGTWSTPASLGGGAAIDSVGLIGPDASNRCYAVLQGTSGSWLRIQPIRSDDTLGSTGNAIPGSDTADQIIAPGGLNTSDQSYYLFIGSADTLSLADWAPADTIPTVNTLSGVSLNTVFGSGRTTVPFVVASLTINGTDLHLVFADNATGKIRHNMNTSGNEVWDAESEINSTAVCNKISALMGVANNINYFYDDDDVLKFGSLKVKGFSAANLSDVKMPQQSYLTPPIEN